MKKRRLPQHFCRIVSGDARMQRLCCKRSMRSSSPHSRTAKKRRWEVLDRLARLGQGLPPAQMTGFGGFKDAWDARMLQEHGDIWPETFMEWTQRFLGENENGKATAFSVFEHNETRRCFDGALALRVP